MDRPHKVGDLVRHRDHSDDLREVTEIIPVESLPGRYSMRLQTLDGTKVALITRGMVSRWLIVEKGRTSK